MNPRFPIYIPSKGRSDSRLTMKALEKLHVPYRVIVEEQEYAEYAKVVGKRKLLVLDPAYRRTYDAMVALKDGESRGSGPARNFAWDHAVSIGADWHWVIDDNIRGFWRFNHNLKVPVADGTIIRCMEDFCLRYDNVAMAGPDYYMFTPRKAKHTRPFTLNTRIYSCNLVRSDVPFRWRGKYNEDTDLSLRLLKAGWCTILFNAFMQWKMTATPGVRMKGGNTEEVYKGGSHLGALEKSKLLVAYHPDVARMVWRFNRWHHHVDYTAFSQNRLRRRAGLKVKNGVDNYGMRIEKNPEWKGTHIPHTKVGRVIGEQKDRFRYGEVLPKDFEIPSSMFWIRKDLETNPFSQVVMRAGDRVMDCGGCIGTFSAAALENGAGHVRCYEPIMKNAEVLKQNLARYGNRKTVVEAALVADSSKTVTMFLASFSGSHSVVDNGKAKTVSVPARSFRAEIKAFKPHIIKLDVEGAEYTLLRSLKPGDLGAVSCVFIEFHPHKERERLIEDARAFLVGEGLTIVKTRTRAFTAIRQTRLPVPPEAAPLMAARHNSP